MPQFLTEEENLAPQQDVTFENENKHIIHKKNLGKYIKIIILILAIVSLVGILYSEYEQTMVNNQLYKTEIEMPDVSGYDIDSATQYLESMDLDVTYAYEDALYTTKDVVIRSNPDKGEIISEEDTVNLVISSSGDYSETDVFLSTTAYVAKYVSLTDLYIQDDCVYATLTNRCDFEVQSVSITLSYYTEADVAIGERSFYLTNLSLAPEETTTVTIPLKNIGASIIKITDLRTID